MNRAGLGINSLDNGINQNEIDLVYSNTNHRLQKRDRLLGFTLDGQSPARAQSECCPKTVRISRLIDFGDYAAEGDYSYLEFSATPNSPRQFDAAQSAAGTRSPVDFFWGRNGSTDVLEALRFRGGGYGFLADVPHGGRVLACGDVAYSLASRSAAEADIYTVALSADRNFNFATGGVDILPGRRVVIVNLNPFILHIFSSSQASTISADWGEADHYHDLTEAGDWLEFIYLGEKRWLARGRMHGASV